MNKLKTAAGLLARSCAGLGILIVYFLSGFAPRRRDRLVFGTWEGKKFCDNAKYLFQHVAANCPELRAVWLSRNPAIVAELRAAGREAYHTASLRAFWACLRSKYIFITHGLSDDVAAAATRGATVLDLFHATFPIKKMGYDHFENMTPAQKLINFINLPLEFKKGDYTFSPSANVSPILHTALRIGRDRIKVTGLPRTDFILSPATPQEERETAAQLAGKRFKHLIYYIPTFRSEPDFSLFAFGYDEGALKEFLAATDSLLVVRFHPFDAKKYAALARDTERIVFDRSDDLYPLMKRADLLVTDYSSVCYDFLLLDRPIVFANFDHDGYIRERGFYHDYAEITPGPKAGSWPELLKAMSGLLAGDDRWAGERRKMLDYIYEYRDTASSRRIVDFVRSLSGAAS